MKAQRVMRSSPTGRPSSDLRLRAATVLTVLLACGDGKDPAGDETTGTSTTGSTATSGGADVPTTGDGSTGQPSVSECDVWIQDCPADQKCVPFSDDGDLAVDASKCVPVDAEPKKSGEACKAVDSSVSGVDDCDKGLLCLISDHANLTGKCVEQCTGSPDAPACPDDKVCSISTNDMNGVLTRCLPPCDPLTQDCAADEICTYNFADYGETWICDAKIPGDGGLYAPCLFSNACDRGLVCVGSVSSTDCDQGVLACCLPLCDLTGIDNCPDALECILWYQPGTEIPGYENVGFCSIPM